MKVLTLPLLLAFIIANYGATKPALSECSKFREGRFGFTRTEVTHWGNSKQVTLRVDSLETIIVTGDITDPKLETLIGSGHTTDTMTFRISWTGNCSYQRSFIKSSVRLMGSLSTPMPQTSGRFEIISFTDKYYIEQSIDDRNRRDTFWIQSSSR